MQKTPIEEALNLPGMKEIFSLSEKNDVEFSNDQIIDDGGVAKESDNAEITNIQDIKQALEKANTLKKLFKTLPEGEDHSKNMEQIREEAMDTFRELINIGVSAEAKHAHHFLDSGTTLLRLALDADNSKLDRKIRLARLKIEQERLVIQERRLDNESGHPNAGNIIDVSEPGIYASRDEIMEKLLSDVGAIKPQHLIKNQ